MEIIRSLKENIAQFKLNLWLGWAVAAIIFITPTGMTLIFGGKIHSWWTIIVLAVLSSFFALISIDAVPKLKTAKKRLALWQSLEDGKYKHTPPINKMYDELTKAEEEFLRCRWNMNAFHSKMRKFQEEIEKTLLK